ncbi:hypothetical protein BJ322DRAFT_697713 [Thelephora terrestris]|uniref:Uncharacterized protein n=1 Tax=Thelephora terrestris TaxID=56493 RepID=A0A9P6HJ39_9AGAM|nr:hypothetical protein BJ322DRAFT_697713 [Thelephora terrestris]
MDPHGIQPFTHAPTNIGNGEQPPPQAFGLQGHLHPPPDYGRLLPPRLGYGGPMPPMGYWAYHQPPGYGPYPLPPRRLSAERSESNQDQRLCQGSDRGFGITDCAWLAKPPLIDLEGEVVAVGRDPFLPRLQTQRRILERQRERKSAMTTWIWWLRVTLS